MGVCRGLVRVEASLSMVNAARLSIVATPSVVAAFAGDDGATRAVAVTDSPCSRSFRPSKAALQHERHVRVDDSACFHGS